MSEFSSLNGYTVKDTVARNIAKGRNQSIAFENYAEMIATLNALEKGEYNVGQNIYIGTVGVPDLWVYSIENIMHTFDYTSDEEAVEMLKNNTTIQCGYYKLAMLEGQKVDLTTYDEAIAELGDKVNECFQSVSDGKSLVASAITDKGVTTDSDATFEVMAENVGKIPSTLKAINLGSTTGSINVKTVCANNGIDYRNLTVNNFAIYYVSGGLTETDQIGGSAIYFACARLLESAISTSYNASTGVFSVSGNSETIWVRDPSTKYNIYSASRTLTCHVRLLYV